MKDSQADTLRLHMQRLFRRFHALSDDTTPCGKAIPMVYAHALMLLLAKGHQTQRELAAELGVDKSNVARLCAKMVDAEHVTQRTAEVDARSRVVALTARGKRLAIDVEAASHAKFERLLRALPADERRNVTRALEVLVHAVDFCSEGEGERS